MIESIKTQHKNLSILNDYIFLTAMGLIIHPPFLSREIRLTQTALSLFKKFSFKLT